jgi:hypothetical protein
VLVARMFPWRTQACAQCALCSACRATLRNAAATALVLGQLLKGAHEIAAYIQRGGRTLTVCFDEARVFKRQVMVGFIVADRTIVALPLQIVADYNEYGDLSRLEESALETQLADNKASASSKPKSANPLLTSKGATAQLFSSLCNSLSNFMQLSFQLAESPAPLRPVQAREERRESQTPNRFVVAHQHTGLVVFVACVRLRLSLLGVWPFCLYSVAVAC